MTPITVSLPIDDRVRAFAFYRDVFDFVAVGEPADDGVPEPLQFELNAGTRLMLVPRGGFGWVIGDHVVAEPRSSECVLSISVATPSAVDAFMERAMNAGGTSIAGPARQPWGYAGTLADLDGHIWMVTAV